MQIEMVKTSVILGRLGGPLFGEFALRLGIMLLCRWSEELLLVGEPAVRVQQLLVSCILKRFAASRLIFLFAIFLRYLKFLFYFFNFFILRIGYSWRQSFKGDAKKLGFFSFVLCFASFVEMMAIRKKGRLLSCASYVRKILSYVKAVMPVFLHITQNITSTLFPAFGRYGL